MPQTESVPTKLDAMCTEATASGKHEIKKPRAWRYRYSKSVVNILVMSTSQEFPGHRKPGHYEPGTAVSRDFPRDPGGPVPVRNT